MHATHATRTSLIPPALPQSETRLRVAPVVETPEPFATSLPKSIVRQLAEATSGEHRRTILRVYRARKAAWALHAIDEVAVFLDGHIHVLDSEAPGFRCTVVLLEALTHGDVLPVLAFVPGVSEPIIVRLPEAPFGWEDDS
jgi:hypothetical protein